jgi:hypothetical protein
MFINNSYFTTVSGKKKLAIVKKARRVPNQDKSGMYLVSLLIKS